MRKSSFLIRFIDIGLIILFGFVIISDITIRSQIELPTPDEEQIQRDEERDLSLIVVNIDPNGHYRLTDFQSATLFGEYQDIETMENALRRLYHNLRDLNETPIALIEPHEEVIMQRLINVLDACDRVGIRKNINIKSMSL